MQDKLTQATRSATAAEEQFAAAAKINNSIERTAEIAWMADKGADQVAVTTATWPSWPRNCRALSRDSGAVPDMRKFSIFEKEMGRVLHELNKHTSRKKRPGRRCVFR